MISRWNYWCSLHIMLMIIICATFPTLIEGQSCVTHLSVLGVAPEDISTEGNVITINYYVRTRHLMSATRNNGTRHLYSIHWDEDVAPLIVARDLKFSKFFKIYARKNTWMISAKRDVLNRSTLVEKVETESAFGPFSDSLTCMVILRHHFVDHMAKSDQLTISGSHKPTISEHPEVLAATNARTSKTETLRFTSHYYYTELDINDLNATTIFDTYPEPISVMDSEGEIPGNVTYSVIIVDDQGNEKEYFRVEANTGELVQVAALSPEVISQNPISFIIKAKDDLGSTAQSVLEVLLVHPSDAFYLTGHEDYLSTSAIPPDAKEEFNYKITVGIIGGFLGLLFIGGIAAGIYYNHKKGLKMGIFHRRPKVKKTISMLGTAYPNIAMSNTDLRQNSSEVYGSANLSPYPNYAYANPSAIEPAPTQYDPKIKI